MLPWMKNTTTSLSVPPPAASPSTSIMSDGDIPPSLADAEPLAPPAVAVPSTCSKLRNLYKREGSIGHRCIQWYCCCAGWRTGPVAAAPRGNRTKHGEQSETSGGRTKAPSTPPLRDHTKRSLDEKVEASALIQARNNWGDHTGQVGWGEWLAPSRPDLHQRALLKEVDCFGFLGPVRAGRARGKGRGGGTACAAKGPHAPVHILIEPRDEIRPKGGDGVGRAQS